MLKEQARTEIERIFDNPEAWHVVKNTYGNITIDEPILKVEWVADQILALFEQSKQAALKEQMGRVIEVIDKEINRAEEGIKATTNGFWRGYWAGIKDTLKALKTELEGENELVLEYGCRYLNSFFECEKGLLISGKCPNNCIYYDDGSR